MPYGSGRFMVSQKQALEQLVRYLAIAENERVLKTGKIKALLDAIEDETTTIPDAVKKPHPNAVLLEAILMLQSISDGTHRSMYGYSRKLLTDFDRRGKSSAVPGIWLPGQN